MDKFMFNVYHNKSRNHKISKIYSFHLTLQRQKPGKIYSTYICSTLSTVTNCKYALSATLFIPVYITVYVIRKQQQKLKKKIEITKIHYKATCGNPTSQATTKSELLKYNIRTIIYIFCIV